MRLLLDECVDARMRRLFNEHECQSARYAGLAGLKNGALLSAAEEAGFEVLVTTDQGIRHQQDIRSRALSMIVLSAATNRLSDLERLVPIALRALKSIKPGQVVTIDTRD